MSVVNVFLYDGCVSSFRPAFVSLCQESSNIWVVFDIIIDI